MTKIPVPPLRLTGLQEDDSAALLRADKAEHERQQLQARSETFCHMMEELLQAQLACSRKQCQGIVDILRDTADT